MRAGLPREPNQASAGPAEYMARYLTTPIRTKIELVADCRRFGACQAYVRFRGQNNPLQGFWDLSRILRYLGRSVRLYALPTHWFSFIASHTELGPLLKGHYRCIVLQSELSPGRRYDIGDSDVPYGVRRKRTPEGIVKRTRVPLNVPTVYSPDEANFGAPMPCDKIKSPD